MGFKSRKQWPPSRCLWKLLVFASFFIVQSGFVIPFPDSPGESNNQKTLNRILEETGDYCERVKNMALFYVCKEKVVAVKYFYSRRDLEKFSLTAGKLKARDSRQKTFTYDYQLVKKEKELRERRILLEEDGKEKYEEDVELRPVKYIGKYLVYGPVGFLSKYWQKRFDYEIVGEDVIDGKETIIIQSSPKKEREENDNYGRVWVDKKNFSILKIEYDPRSIKDYEDELILSPIGDLKKKVVWTVNFGVEKKGVRFPSKQLVQEYYVNNEGKTVLVEEVTFHYVDYKFFIVEVEVKY